ncbi:hypothetical protein OF83DRAFT_451333 [Amylostereum chailletii]|nr:hypothetical protein OF83DRAFT_451333 [Amylostereum chailletii]
MTTERPQASCYIHRLPPELLIQIFIHHETLPPITSRDRPTSKAPTCAALLQVCSRWRAAAETCSDLWTTLPVGSPHWTKTALRRSSNRPLDLCTTAHPMACLRPGRAVFPATIATARHAIAHAMGRMRAIALDPATDLIADLARAPAPTVLEILELRAEPLASHAQIVTGAQATIRNALALPDPLFRGPLPKLRALYLKNVDLARSPTLLSSRLTALGLWEARITPGGNIASLLCALRGLPNLEDLRLTRTVSYGADTARDLLQIPPVELPRLRTLVLEDHAKLVSGLVKRIVYPRTCSLAVRFVRVEPVDVPTIYTILTTAVLSDVDANASYPSLRLCQRTCDLQPGLFSSECEIVRFVADAPPSPALPPRVEIALDFSGHDARTPSLLAPVCDALPGVLRRAHRLAVDHRGFQEGAMWLPLRVFSRVREVEVVGEVEGTLREAMREKKSLFPTLERVGIAGEASEGEGEGEGEGAVLWVRSESFGGGLEQENLGTYVVWGGLPRMLSISPVHAFPPSQVPHDLPIRRLQNLEPRTRRSCSSFVFFLTFAAGLCESLSMDHRLFNLTFT